MSKIFRHFEKKITVFFPYFFQIAGLILAAICVAVDARMLRFRRDTPVSSPKFGGNLRRDLPPAPAPLYVEDKADPYHKPGQVGPVYTFVKTDPYANFKWGVRHVAGVQYGRR